MGLGLADLPVVVAAGRLDRADREEEAAQEGHEQPAVLAE